MDETKEKERPSTRAREDSGLPSVFARSRRCAIVGVFDFSSRGSSCVFLTKELASECGYEDVKV